MKRLPALLVLALAAAAAACRPVLDADPATADYPCLQPSDSVGNRALMPPGYYWTIDDQYAEMARTIPGGFGGMWYGTVDGRGKPGGLNFYLKDLSKATEAAAALGSSPTFALQGKYDYLQLKSCYEAMGRVDFGSLSAQIRTTDIDETQNRIALGIASLAAEADFRAALERARLPGEMFVFEAMGAICSLVGIPAVVAEVRDERGRPTAIGATVAAAGPNLAAQGEGWGDSLRIFTRGSENVGGTFTVTVTKPWYTTAVLKDVTNPEGECGIAASKRVSATISLLPGAPPVRQVVAPPFGYGFGDGNISEQLRAYVEADSGVSHEVSWVSRDPSVATVTPDGRITSACRTSTGETYVVASAVAAPAIKDSVAVTVWAADRGSGRCP